MLHDILRLYLEEAEIAIARIKDAYVEQYQEEILTPNRVNLRVRVRFADGSLLELNEAVIVEANVIEHLDYRYHLQDARNHLLFRYDNTPPFRTSIPSLIISTFAIQSGHRRGPRSSR